MKKYVIIGVFVTLLLLNSCASYTGTSAPDDNKEMLQSDNNVDLKMNNKGMGEVYTPDSFYNLSSEYDYGEIIDKYTLCPSRFDEEDTYEGNIGEIIPAYNNIDLDGDGMSDAINRYVSEEGREYEIEFSDGSKLNTPLFEKRGVGGELIEFHDINEDNVDEIIITQFGMSTKDWMVEKACFIYKEGNAWTYKCITDEYEDIFGVELIDTGVVLLADYGDKYCNCYDVFKFELNNGKLRCVMNSSELVKIYWPIKYENSYLACEGLKDELKERYSDAIEDIYMNGIFPDGSDVPFDMGKIEDDTARIWIKTYDYTSDGNQELLVEGWSEDPDKMFSMLFSYVEEDDAFYAVSESIRQTYYCTNGYLLKQDDTEESYQLYGYDSKTRKYKYIKDTGRIETFDLESIGSEYITDECVFGGNFNLPVYRELDSFYTLL